MKKNILVLLFTGLIAFSACSPKTPKGLANTSNYKKLGIDNENLIKIDSLIGSALINNWISGATALVAKNSEVVYFKGMGFLDRESKTLMQGSDLFRIASMTKPIVSVAAMKLVEEGKLNLEDPISKFIPEFKNPTVLASFNEEDTTYTTIKANKEITVKNLLTHTSGIGYGFANKKLKMIYEKNNIPDLASVEPITMEQVAKKLAKLPLAVQPDSEFFYGLNTDILGRVVEVASGMPLDSFLNKNIFEPLEMKNTFFTIPKAKRNRLAIMYSQNKDGRLVRTEPIQGKFNINYPLKDSLTYLSGGSGLTSNAIDDAIFLQMILNKGIYKDKRILKEETIALMGQNQIGDLNVRKNKFGLGFEITTNAGELNGSKAGKLNWGGIFNTTFWIDPQRNSLAILMVQVFPSTNAKELHTKFEKIVNEVLDTEPKKK